MGEHCSAIQRLLAAVKASPLGEACRTCGGIGEVMYVWPEHDPRCGGSGSSCPVPVPCPVPCRACAGTGLVVPEFAGIRDALAALEGGRDG